MLHDESLASQALGHDPTHKSNFVLVDGRDETMVNEEKTNRISFQSCRPILL